MGKRVPKQLKNFQVGMTPYPNAEGIYKKQHFDVVNNQLKPYRGLEVSVAADCDRVFNIIKAVNVTGATTSTLFALGNNYGDTKFIILKWDISLGEWKVFKASGVTADYNRVLHYYNGYFIGLRLGTHIWRINNGAVELTHVALSYTSGDVDMITHTKDGLVYIAVDNKIYSYNGSAATLGKTLPTTFTITSIAEQGDHILVVGYDTSNERSTAYLWDRDVSVATWTQKYDLGNVRSEHSANLGNHWIISTTWESGNTTFLDQAKLIIGYINGDRYKVHKKFNFKSIDIYAKYLEEDNLYFAATFAMLDDSATRSAIFRLDAAGELHIEQELGINSTNAQIFGIIKDGDGFWFGADTNIGYNTSEVYDAEATIETNMYEPDSLSMNFDTIGVAATFDPLPAGASVTIATRADAETDWDDIVTFADDSAVKGSFPGKDIERSRLRQFKLTSSGGAVINSFQADLEEVPDEEYN